MNKTRKTKTNKMKRIPILSYLCYLLVVSILFTGVTFSRYTTATSGDLGAAVTPFVASYEINDISSNTYTNANFWLNNKNQQGTPRTVRFTLRNYECGEDGQPVRISALKLKATLRLYLPAEFADNLVLQVTGGNGETAVTPQIVLGNLIYQVNDGGTGDYTYVEDAQGNRIYAQYPAAGAAVRESGRFPDYSARAGAAPERYAMQGGIADGSGTVTAEGAYSKITIAASKQKMQYSVGFRRERGQGAGSEIYSQLYLDLEKEIPFYTIDIDLSGEALEDAFDLDFDRAGVPQEKQFVLYLTLAENIRSEDYNYDWVRQDDQASQGEPESLDHLLTAPGADSDESVYTFNGAQVTGYHFDANAATVNADLSPRNTDTQIRVQKTYGRDADGNYNGNNSVSFSHVAPISETTVNYVHAIGTFYRANETGDGVAEAALPAVPQIGDYQSLYGVCTNLDGKQGEDGYYLISLAGITDNAFWIRHHEGGTERELSISYSLSKSYFAQLGVVFTQASSTGGNGI